MDTKNTFAFTMPLLNKSEEHELIASCGELGADPSSEYFTKRTKNIAFVMCIEGQWFQMRANHFIQPEHYNDFSGGYKRSYREFPKTFLECKATQKVLSTFKALNDIPDGELILIQVQSSLVSENDADRCLTGQGIHSDGADRAMVVALARENITGAENAVYADLKGEQTLVEPFTLEEGHALLWQDNSVFHYVGPAQVIDPRREGVRTVLIAHYPATQYLSGKINPNNSLKTNEVEESLRLRNK